MIDTTAVLVVVVAMALAPRLLVAWALDMTWDEGLYVVAGMMALRNIRRRDFSREAWSFEFHPPFAMYLAAISYVIYVLIGAISRCGWAALLHPERIEEEAVRLFRGRSALLAIRLPAILAGALTCLVAFLLSKEMIGNIELAAIGALVLAVMPSFVAWTSVAMLEGSVALFYALTLFFLLKATVGLSIEVLIISGVFLGLLMCSKETGFGAIPTVLAWSALVVGGDFFGGPGEVSSFISYLALWLLIGLLTFWVSWPLLYRKPVQELGGVFRSTSKMVSRPSSGFSFYFRGLASMVPTPVLVLTLYGALASVLVPSPAGLLVILWLLVPLAIMGLPFVPKRGGPYEVAFVLPPVVILAATSLGLPPFGSWISESLTVGTILGCALVLLLLVEGVIIHPRYVDYHSLVGRMMISDGKRLVGWWGHGMSAAMSFIDSHAPMGATVWIYGPRVSALYHSRRVDLQKSLGASDLFFERARVGRTVPIDTMFMSWRQGDLKFIFPYYPSYGVQDKVETLPSVSHIVVYRWAIHDQEVTGLDEFDSRLVKWLTRHCVPVTTIKTGQLQVCWIYEKQEILEKLRCVGSDLELC